MFAGCGSEWKNPCRKTIVIHASASRYAMSRRSSGRIASRSRSATFVPRRNSSVRIARGRVLPDHARHDDLLVAGEVAVERLGVARLVPVVELEPDRARELVHELLRVHELERLHALAQEPRGLVQQAEVGLDLIGGGRALHLDGDLLPVRQDRAMHLADRRRRERREVELEERAIHPQVELGLDGVANLLERDRRGGVLQPAQLGDDVRRHDVGARREELAELDERRPELVEHHPQAPTAVRAPWRRRRRRRSARSRPRGCGAGRSRSRGAPRPARSPRDARGCATAGLASSPCAGL